jgi:hypothetical protein
MCDPRHALKAGIVLEELGLGQVENQDLPIGLICVRRDPPTPSLAAKTGFRIFLQIFNRIFGARLSRACPDGHLFFLLGRSRFVTLGNAATV